MLTQYIWAEALCRWSHQLPYVRFGELGNAPPQYSCSPNIPAAGIHDPSTANSGLDHSWMTWLQGESLSLVVAPDDATVLGVTQWMAPRRANCCGSRMGNTTTWGNTYQGSLAVTVPTPVLDSSWFLGKLCQLAVQPVAAIAIIKAYYFYSLHFLLLNCTNLEILRIYTSEGAKGCSRLKCTHIAIGSNHSLASLSSRIKWHGWQTKC